MSYSQKLKAELLECIDQPGHCMRAELAGIFCIIGHLEETDGGFVAEFRSDNEQLVRKCFTLLKKSYIIEGGDLIDRQGAGIFDSESARQFCEGLGLDRDSLLPDLSLLGRSCCKRAFLRGVFLASGSMNDPQNSYHLELVCPRDDRDIFIRDILSQLGISARRVLRKGRRVIYLKDGESIVELLGLMGAHRSYMEFENLRIYKEMRGSINRRVNCETANITKTVNAASKQIEDIILIRDRLGLAALPEGLSQIAALRLEFPEIPLRELGEKLDPPIGKSGVNHRLRKLSEIAEKLICP